MRPAKVLQDMLAVGYHGNVHTLVPVMVFSSCSRSSSCCDITCCCICSSSRFSSPAVAVVSTGGALRLCPGCRREDLPQEACHCDQMHAEPSTELRCRCLPVILALSATQGVLQLLFSQLQGAEQVSPPIPLILRSAGGIAALLCR